MNITVIVPVHEFDEKVSTLLSGALKSVSEQKGIEQKSDVILVHAHSIKDKIESFLKEFETDLNINLVSNENDTSFQSQINLGVEHVKTDYFSILEYDDELSNSYFKIANEYISKLDKVDLFLPFIVEVNENDQALKITNETVWSKSFVGENGVLGYLNASSLNQYTDFKICGGIFKKSEFEAVGKLKKNIKLTFQYEFLLRLLNNGSNIYCIPKIGVKHLALREGSLFYTYSKTLTLKERKFWFDTAKKEHHFFNDREIDEMELQKE